MTFVEWVNHERPWSNNMHQIDVYKLVWNAALGEAIDLCQAKFDLRSYGGFPREASTARTLREEIASLKA